MNLDADRLAQLAGLPSSNKRNLSEASNRSLHDDPSVSDEQDHRFGKGQLAERGSKKGDQSATHLDYEEKNEDGHTEEGMHYEGGAKKGDQSATHLDYEKNETLEINEEMLAEEIARMRSERIQENELRGIIRAEIGSIIKDLKKESAGSKSKTKSRASKMRGVTMGMTGPGFR
tara:strand:+ start:298 stop:819 length:522 start_codon:yes stop_codon:yes gene_type:complete